MTDTPKPSDALEPEARAIYNGAPDRAIQLSQAISLKRLADAIEAPRVIVEPGVLTDSDRPLDD